MTRPRAADDFAMIRARMEELRWERAAVRAEPQARPEPPRAYPKPNVPATRNDQRPQRPTPAATRSAADDFQIDRVKYQLEFLCFRSLSRAPCSQRSKRRCEAAGGGWNSLTINPPHFRVRPFYPA